MRWLGLLAAAGLLPGQTSRADSALGYITALPVESPAAREARHKQVSERRSGPIVIVHRGASAFAPENTLEAFAAAMDYGADGCEIDIRRAADGVLFTFHDDGLDRMTDALGPISQHPYAELLGIKFRDVYGAPDAVRIPTLVAVLHLARQRAMLLHLDVKEPGLEDDIAALLDAADMWDHVVEINVWNATALRQNPHYRGLRYKAFGLQDGRADMDPEMVGAALARPGNMIMVDDPRVASRELRRSPRPVPLPEELRAPLPERAADPQSAVSPMAYVRSVASRVDGRSFAMLAALLSADLPARAEFDGGEELQRERARRILERAWAAQRIGELGDPSVEAVRVLEQAVTQRTLHRDGSYRGLDGAMAARALGVLGATEAVPFLVQTFQAVDPELQKLVEPPGSYPYAWADYRMKTELISVLGALPCEPGKRFLREYLAMDKEAAGRFSMPQVEEATRALLRHPITTEELEELLRSPNSAVRGTATLVCLDDRTVDRAAELRAVLPWTQELPRVGARGYEGGVR